MRIDDVKKFPVNVHLTTKNPWKGIVKVNNIVVSVVDRLKIRNKEELIKLLPIEKYLIIEEIEEVKAVVEEPVPVPVKKTRKKKEV
jgi:hypothetical protein